MDKESENKIETHNKENVEIMKETTSQNTKKTTKQTTKKTAAKKPDSTPKKNTVKTNSSQSKAGVKKTVSPSSAKGKKETAPKKEDSKPQPKNAPKKTSAKKTPKKETQKDLINASVQEPAPMSGGSVIITDTPVKNESAKTDKELFAANKSETPKQKKAVKNTAPKKTAAKKVSQEKTQSDDDEKSALQDNSAVNEAVETAEILEPLKVPEEHKAENIQDTDIKAAEQQNEQTITLSNESYSSSYLTPEDQEQNAQEVSSDQAALIAQTAISQEALLENDAAILLPQIADGKSIPAFEQQIKKLLIYGIIILSLIAAYLGFSLYFKSHFYFGATINGISISGLSVNDAKLKLCNALENYALTITQRGGTSEQIKSQDLSLSYNSLDDLDRFIDSQNGYAWIGAIFSKDNDRIIVTSYDSKLLKTQIENLSCVQPENMVKPQNPTFKYTDGSYVIIAENIGSKIDKHILYSCVADAVSVMNESIDLEQTECYVKPAYTAASQKTLDVQMRLNTYAAANITYIIGKNQIVVDSSKITSWLSVDDDLNIVFNKNKINSFINTLANTSRNTSYTRTFKTASGKTVKISGGDYGRYFSVTKETDYLINKIKKGATVTKNFSDIGNTYAEISISKQHIWFYKNGKLIADGSIVTGNVSNHTSTRKGVFYLKARAYNVTLKGDDYEADVSYWMPFDGGIGMHDATWRSYFGGSIYYYNGSHGCVNLPYWLARKIYYNISVGTPVVVY